MTDQEHAGSRVPRLVAGAVIVLSGCACLLIYYVTRVCDEQLSSSGTTVRVCRHLTVTDPPIVLTGLVALLALTAFFNEISGFGFTLKRDVRQAIANSEAARSESQATRAVSETAEQVALETARGSTPTVSTISELDDLAAEYDEVRASLPSSNARTARLTQLVSRMIAVAAADHGQFDAISKFTSSDDGARVASYAYTYSQLDPALTAPLVKALIAEPTAFGQYWAIRALRGLVRRNTTALTSQERHDLERLLRTISPSSDRWVELRGLLDEAA